jgi:signal transduction histidine kinase
MPGAARRTLVVDDEPDLRFLVRLALERTGRYAIVGEARDGHEALEQADRHRPELVLLDLSMPRMDGLETLPRLRALLPDSHLVVLSGFATDGASAPATRAGADAYIEKGLPPSALVAAIDQATLRGGAAAEVSRTVIQPATGPRSAADLLARLAHDVRSPLTTASGAVELLRATLPASLDPQHRELLRRATASLERIDRTLRSSIEHAHSGHVRLAPEELTVGALVGGLLTTVADAPGRVRVDGDATVRVFADGTALQRVLANLIENGLRYSDGPVTVRWARQGQQLVVEVEDEGPGLGPDPASLFEPFVRGAGARDQVGFGLGLATAAELVRRMQGEIAATDGALGGATFRVSLPAA